MKKLFSFVLVALLAIVSVFAYEEELKTSSIGNTESGYIIALDHAEKVVVFIYFENSAVERMAVFSTLYDIKENNKDIRITDILYKYSEAVGTLNKEHSEVFEEGTYYVYEFIKDKRKE